MITPKAREVVERVEKAAADIADKHAKSWDWDDDRPADEIAGEVAYEAAREAAHFGIRLALEMEGVTQVVACLEHAIVRGDFEHGGSQEAWATDAINKFAALKLLHVPSGEG